MKPHKHAELIKAWADGLQIEAFNPEHQKWIATSNPGWFLDIEYRVKPYEVPDVIFEGCVQYDSGLGVEFLRDVAQKNIRLSFNYWTGELKSAEVLK